MLRDFRDLDPDELREELRCGRDAQHRRQAALELGELNDMGGVPWLLNAVLHDPEPLVARAAREILRGMIGASLDEALKLEAGGEPLEDPWLSEACMLEEDWDADLAEVEDWTESGEAAALTTEQSEMLHGLTLVVRGEPNPALRIKAVHALGKIPDMEAIRVLAELAISENAEAVRSAAHDVLEQRFGDDLPELLDFYRLEVNGAVEIDADDEPQSEQWETVRQIAAEHPPVMEEENRGRWVWIVLGGLAIAGLLLVLTLR